MPPALAVRDLRKRYGTTEALRGVDLEVGDGEVVGLLGPNGAGKSTLVGIAAGLVRATAGTAEVAGAPAGSRAARAAVGYLAERFAFPGWATADETLRLHGRLAGAPLDRAGREGLLAEVGLEAAADRRVDAMSKGMQQRLGIAQALVGRPRLVLLDEPTSALDPVGRRTVRELLGRLRASGTGVLLSSHLLTEIEQVCDRVAVVLHGEVVARGAPADLMRPRGVELETDAGVRLVAAAGREDVPRIVAEAVAAGERVYGVRLLTSSLEDAYLEAVGA